MINGPHGVNATNGLSRFSNQLFELAAFCRGFTRIGNPPEVQYMERSIDNPHHLPIAITT